MDLEETRYFRRTLASPILRSISAANLLAGAKQKE
jgi:hypothetical protein